MEDYIGGQGEGMETPHLFAKEKKVGEEDKKEEFKIKNH